MLSSYSAKKGDKSDPIFVCDLPTLPSVQQAIYWVVGQRWKGRQKKKPGGKEGGKLDFGDRKSGRKKGEKGGDAGQKMGCHQPRN